MLGTGLPGLGKRQSLRFMSVYALFWQQAGGQISSRFSSKEIKMSRWKSEGNDDAFLSCSLSPWRPSKFGVRVIISVQHRVKALLCPMIYSEAVAAKLQAIYTYSLFHEGWR